MAKKARGNTQVSIKWQRGVPAKLEAGICLERGRLEERTGRTTASINKERRGLRNEISGYSEKGRKKEKKRVSH